MKKRTQVALLLAAVMMLQTIQATGQAPGLFNFQAILRDADHEVISGRDVSVQLSIRKGSEQGPAQYVEKHNTSSGPIGQITLLVGSGTFVSGDLYGIDWSNDTYYMQVEVDPDNGTDYINMGASQLATVPFALQAGSIKAPLENLVILQPEGSSPDDALFEVKREDGSTVFAVYNEGVRIYMDETPVKGTKGGFAVGGYTKSKGITNEYLRVTPDSVRVWLNEPVKGIKGGFAVGGYTQNKSEPVDYLQLDPVNYFIGHEAGQSTTSGIYNSFLGYQSGVTNTEGSNNMFFGYQSGYHNTNGSNNIFIGKNSGYENQTGADNVFIGVEAGRDNKTGILNTYVGHQAGLLADSGRYNTFLGFWAGYNLYGGHLNTFIGAHAGHFAETGDLNTVVGAYAGSEKDFGWHNTFIGMRAGSNNEGDGNTLLGSYAGVNNEMGRYNVMVGNSAGEWSKGEFNVYIGESAGLFDEGNNNVFIGRGAGGNNQRSHRLFIENWDADSSQALVYGEFDNDVLRFNGNVGVNCQPSESLHVNGQLRLDGMLYSNMPAEAKGFRTPSAFDVSAEFAATGNFISFGDPGVSEDFIGYKENTFWFLDSPEGGDSFDPNVYVGGDLEVGGTVQFTSISAGGGTYDLRIDADGLLHRDASDMRLKHAFEKMEHPLEKVLQMNAYSFLWRDGKYRGRDVGFIAQEVEEVLPEVVYTNPNDGMMGINYSRIPALLVEAIKEQQQIIEEKEREIDELRTRIEQIEKLLNAD